MNISPVNFTGTLYFPNQQLGINTDHIVKFKNGSSGKTQVWLSNGDVEQLHVPISDFKSAYTKAIRSKDEFIEVKSKSSAVKI